jgi:hypothetical protein
MLRLHCTVPPTSCAWGISDVRVCVGTVGARWVSDGVGGGGGGWWGWVVVVVGGGGGRKVLGNETEYIHGQFQFFSTFR